jgi:hypothetical protein
MTALARHEYWADAPEPLQVATLSSAALVGHRQVTDAYLLGLAALRSQCLATPDRGLLTFAQAVALAANVEPVSALPAVPVQEPSARYRTTRESR